MVFWTSHLKAFKPFWAPLNQTLYLTGVLWPINDGFRTKIVPISQLLTILGGKLPLLTYVEQGIGVSRTRWKFHRGTVRFGPQLGPVILLDQSIRIRNE